MPLWLGVDLGLFKKYGVNLEPILFRGGAESANALTGGEIQFDVVAPQPHIAADLSGADIVIIGTYFNKHTYSVVARPGIRSPQELRRQKDRRPVRRRIESNRRRHRAKTLGHR